MSSPSHQYINYRSLNDLERALQVIATRLPPSVNTVVGVPRSGLLAASILALHLNLPFTDLDGFMEGRVLATGRREPRSVTYEGPTTLVIDDSVASGESIDRARTTLRQAGHTDDAIFAAPYVIAARADRVDLFGEIVEMPRVFAWNIMHHPPLLLRACVDIDGVLCLDPTADENDDGPNYVNFLGGVKPLYLPSCPVRFVVTSRLERYRPDTEAWLAANGVEYDQLVMLDLPDAVTRRATNSHARHKAEFYAASDAELFIESDYNQSVEIAAFSGRQVFCIDRREMVFPSALNAARRAPRPLLRSISQRPPGDELLEHYLTVRRSFRGTPPEMALRIARGVKRRLGT